MYEVIAHLPPQDRHWFTAICMFCGKTYEVNTPERLAVGDTTPIQCCLPKYDAQTQMPLKASDIKSQTIWQIGSPCVITGAPDGVNGILGPDEAENAQ